MHLAASRDALERFTAELPSGLHADRLRRGADATRALIEQALAQRDGASPWVDHNLAVVVADGLAEAATRPMAQTLFLGVRRRLAEALAADPDDLAPALALALGLREEHDGPRAADDVALVAAAVARPQAGPRLLEAAIDLIAGLSGLRDEALSAAARAAAAPVREAADRLSARLPYHPDAALARVRVAFLEAREAEGEARAHGLARVRSLLHDLEARFGQTEGGRELLAGVLGLEARGAAVAADLRRDTLELLDADIKAASLDAKRAQRLVRTLERGGALDKATAATFTARLMPHIDKDDPRWFEVRAALSAASGDDGALMTLWQRAIEANPGDKAAARGLGERLVQNLRRGLQPPFENAILDLVLTAMPPDTAGKLGGDDVDRLIAVVTERFGTARAFAFLRDTLLQVRELRAKEGLWRRVLALAQELTPASDELLGLARAAMQHVRLPEANLALARVLVERREQLDEADDALRPLMDKKGPFAAEAQALKQRLQDDPALRRARYDTLLAYEHQLGVGGSHVFPLRVVYTASSYALAEIVDKPAPPFYDHHHLRVMLRPEDLPEGVSAADLQKGDVVHAPVRGQDGDPTRDRDVLRIYWVSDPKRVRLEVDAAAVAARWDAEERAYGIGTGQLVPLKVAWDSKRERVTARLLHPTGGSEFRARPAVPSDRLPPGVEAEKLGGKGRRLWGQVARVDDGSGGRRQYAVVSDLTADDPNPRAPEAKGAPEGGERSGKRKRRRGGRGGDPEASRGAEATGESKAPEAPRAVPGDATPEVSAPKPERGEETSEVSAPKPELGEATPVAAAAPKPARGEETSEVSAPKPPHEEAPPAAAAAPKPAPADAPPAAEARPAGDGGDA